MKTFYRKLHRISGMAMIQALRCGVLAIGMLLGLAGTGVMASAQAAYPDSPIHLILGYPPGGGTDTVARVMAQALTKTLHESVVVENRGGASGTIAAAEVARANPDGYTLFFTTGASLTGAPLTVAHLAYDPVKDFTPITLIGGGPFILVATPSFPPNTMPELVQYAKQHPGKVNFASPGISTADYFFLALLNLNAGINVTHVPYKGSSALMTDVMSGQVQYTLDTPGTTLPLIRAGKLKAIAVLSDKRLTIAPEIPTTVEQGFPYLVGGSWYGIVAPKGTPNAIVQKVYEASKEALQSPDVRAALARRDVLASGSPPQQFGDFIRSEYVKWKGVLDRLGIKPQ